MNQLLLVVDDKTFLQPREGLWMHCSDFLSYPLTAQNQVIAIKNITGIP